MAFGLRNRHSNQYFEEDKDVWGWTPTIMAKGPGNEYKTYRIPVHKCTEKDWAKFPPPADTDKSMI